MSKASFVTRVSAIALVCALGVIGTARADILIKNATLYDGTGAPAVKGANILVKGDRIAQVSTKPISAGRAKVIDATGKFVMPGIMDSHVHLRGGQQGSVRDGNRKPIVDRSMAMPTLYGYLYSGVTSVFDSGNNAPFIIPLRDDERAGKILSPRIFAAGGVISVPGGYGAGATAMKATTWEATKPLLEAKITADRPDMLKLTVEQQGLYAAKAVPTLSADMVKHITDYARERGVRSTVHVSSEWNAQLAADNGITAMAHPVTRSVLNDSFIKTLVDKKIPISTTMQGYITVAKLGEPDGTAYLDGPLFKATMTPEEIAETKGPEAEDYIKNDLPAQRKVQKKYAYANIKRLYDADVILTSGTDKAYGPYTHVEIQVLNEAGITPFQLIKVATLNGAIYVGREKDLGSIEPGKYADILVLDADPAADVKNFQAINAVIKGGQQIDRSKLDLPINHKKS